MTDEQFKELKDLLIKIEVNTRAIATANDVKSFVG